MCESYVQPYSKPSFSACCSTSTSRVYGGAGRTVTPKLSIVAGGVEHTAPKSARMALAFLLLAVAAGGALPFQAGINARLATFVGGPIRASAISFAVGTIVLVLLALIATRGVMSTCRLGSVPWWGWLGGAVGAGYVASAVAAAPRLGALNLF